MKETILRKLTSRKFWAALIGFVTAILLAFNADSMTVEQVTAVLGALATLIAYMFSEGMTDAKSAGTAKTEETNAIGTSAPPDASEKK